MSLTNRGHRRSTSGHSHTARSRSPPSQTFHSSILPQSVPTPALLGSIASGAHYSGVPVDPDTIKHRRTGSDPRRSSSHVDVKEDHNRVLGDLKELYCCRPTMEILERSWHKDAVFEDPFVSCKGYDEYAAQWFALPKVISKSETLSTRVMSSTHSPNRFVYSQRQEYTLRLFGVKKLVTSIIIVDLDEDNKIIRLVDQWDGKDVPAHYGAGFLRRVNGKFGPWLVRVPKP
ncbi:hypothetical protein Moror_2325 [Moniliophthora roreri MCA 2997]|uniref:Uncharacterized protein n=2 Tax=Moniliophthora roreri TaxID=221103 RepID=V2WWD6_MONRO|nr:hypothetical protein Moror_2325 [Moniliophthora roreri MCA 2997]